MGKIGQTGTQRPDLELTDASSSGVEMAPLDLEETRFPPPHFINKATTIIQSSSI
jgi:hypothetical protein